MATKERDLFEGVNMVEDPENPTDLEKKHVPVITAPDEVKANEPFDVTVEVGKLKAHPDDPDHFINFITLYAGHVYLARLDLVPGRTKPTMKTTVVLDKDIGPLRAFEYCNIHGTWEGRKEIAVK
jgi:superoxide reductase